ncbi:MAG TPA: response regulator [Allosphingosinicella sp.]|nr:response regulator [Allosphingosinicella sp.]
MVYIVDDEREVRVSLSFLLKAFAISSRPFSSAEDFLAELPDLRPGCVVVDVRMPSKDGISMVAEMASAGVHWPVIVISGHAEVNMAVRAMKLGAIEFLEKPFSEQDLLAALDRGFEHLARTFAEHDFARMAQLRISKLTPRERLVLDGVLAGLANKEMAARAGLSTRTVEMHRTRMMRRVGVDNVPQLIAIAYAAGLRSPGDGSSS